MISFISNVKQSVAKHHLLPWIVKQKVQVQPGELAETMQLIRNDIESEHNIIQTIFLRKLFTISPIIYYLWYYIVTIR